MIAVASLVRGRVLVLLVSTKNGGKRSGGAYTVSGHGRRRRLFLLWAYRLGLLGTGDGTCRAVGGRRGRCDDA